MSGIAGFCNLNVNYLNDGNKWLSIASKMANSLSRRGSVANGTFATEHTTFAHTQVGAVNHSDDSQPIIRNINGNKYAIVLDGTIFNSKELKEILSKECCNLKSSTDAEIILNSYICFGCDFVNMLNGVFAFSIWDENKNQLFVARDRFGVKPMFYSISDNTFIFASEIKALFEHPFIKAEIDSEGLAEIFSIGPARTEGFGVFKGVQELISGNYGIFSKDGYRENTYWSLESKAHEDNYQETIEKVKYLVEDAVKRQLVSLNPVCTFLSGGLDSSVVTAIASKSSSDMGFDFIDTFSFDYKDNNKYFKASKFQPSEDRPWVDRVSALFKTKHHYLECSYEDLVELLDDAVIARDLPGMADVDSSLIYFCKEVKKTHTIALTGECADEVFGGYPWFHTDESLEANTFPWTRNIDSRKMLLSDDLIKTINIEQHIARRYENALKKVPKLYDETKKEARRREISYLNIKWFMQTLLERMDRAANGLDARVPFADYKLVEYLWNIPWEMKSNNGVVKGLLREAAKSYLPEDVLMRKKSPFPKTYNPNYENAVNEKLISVLNDNHSPILPLINKENIFKLINSPSDYGKPWFGQLMAGPQLKAYLLQINFWLKKYNISI